MRQEAEVIIEAQFDPKLRTYWVLGGAGMLTLSIIGILLVPFWLLLGPWWAGRQFANLSCQLTRRTLIVKRGVVFRSEKTIPLDKIQDVSLKEGPLLRKLGLARLNIETAGQSAGTAEAALQGVVDVYSFRDRVLAERDRLVERLERQGSPAPAAGGTGGAQSEEVLLEIRDTLQRIERHLQRGGKDAEGV